MSTIDLKASLAALEAEFAALDGPLQEARNQWTSLREQVRTLENEMELLECAIDGVRNSARYIELSTQLPHLRKAVGQ